MSLSKNSNMDAMIMSAAHVLIDDTADYMRSIDTSDTVISKKLDNRVYKNIRKYSKKNWWSSVPVTCKRLVAAVMIFCTITFAMGMSVKAVREEVWNTILEWYDKFVAVFYETDETPPSVIEEYREPTLQLAGAEKQVVVQNKADHVVLYFLNGEQFMSYQQKVITENTANLDSENCITTDLYIGEFLANLFTYEDGVKTITWHDNEYAYIISCDSIEIEINILVDIAESVR